MDAADWFTVITGSIALAAFLGAVPLVGRFVLEVRMWFAKLSLGTQVNRMTPRNSRRSRALWAAWVQTSSLTAGTPHTAADELQWLADATGADQVITFSAERHTDYAALARAYRRYATTLRMRVLLFGSGQPLLERVADVAEGVAEILAISADRSPVDSSGRVVVSKQHITSGYVSARPGVNQELSSILELEELRIDGRFADHHLQVSWLQEHSRRPRRLGEAGDQPREYDGLLPRLIDHRYERDLSSGNYRLHLQLGEIYYSDYKKVSDPDSKLQEEPGDPPEALLTLSLLPVTRDGYMIFAQRGKLTYYPECWGPGAGGNLEISRPGRPNPDTDPHGVVDPLRAIAREAQEEIGLFLPIERIRSMGLVRLSNSEEKGTWLLTTTATTDLSLPELARATNAADPVNGRWEVGESLAAVPVPRSREAAEDLISWALHNRGVMPHLAASLLKLIVAEGSVDPCTLSPRPSDATELPPGGLKFRFGEELVTGPASTDGSAVPARPAAKPGIRTAWSSLGARVLATATALPRRESGDPDGR